MKISNLLVSLFNLLGTISWISLYDRFSFWVGIPVIICFVGTIHYFKKFWKDND